MAKHRKTSHRTMKRMAGLAAVALGASTLTVGTAAAAPAPQDPMGSVQTQVAELQQQFDQQIRNAQREGTKAVLAARDNAFAQTKNLPAHLQKPVREGIDQVVNTIAPGALKAREKAQAPKPAQKQAPRQARQANHPCPADAKGCVDLNGKRAWLQDGSKTTYGPVHITTGRAGQETPRGTFTVTRKVKDEVSYLYNMAPMPYAVYFTDRGHAFHQGDQNSGGSAGCIRLADGDAQKFFYSLNPGDKIYIY